jgi:hypothetical protein
VEQYPGTYSVHHPPNKAEPDDVTRRKRAFGGIRQLRSGRYQANYTGPDAVLHNAPHTFDTREDAEAWLTDVRRQISRGEWNPKGAKKKPLTTFAV